MAAEWTPEPAAAAKAAAMAERTFAEHGSRLRAWLITMTHDEAAAEDLAQEAFLRLLREAREGRTPENPVAWLHRVAANLATSRGRRLTVADRRAGELPLPGGVDSPEESVVAREEAAALHSALSALAGDDRRALLLAAHGYRGGEIAEQLGRTDGATRTLLCRARAKIRERLLLSGAF